MPPSPIEDEIYRVIHAHLTAGTEKGVETIDNFMAYISDTFTGIGTGPDEFIRDRDSFREVTLQERREMIYDVDLEIHKVYVRSLSPSLVLAEGALTIKVHMEVEEMKIMVRFSFLLENTTGTWLIMHSHFSVPDYRLDEGGTLMDALQKRNAELEREVAQRTHELNESLQILKDAQAQLIHQEKMASLGALTAGIAHEIKNPLNFITNFANLSVDLAQELGECLARGEDVKDLLEDLKHNATAINNHGQRADAIVKNMMRHASGKVGERVDTPIHTLLEEYITLALHGKKARIPGFTCTIERTFDTRISTIKTIPSELGRVFLNLLSNAFDAMKEQNNAKVEVTTRKLDASIQIIFADNGPGIPLENQDKIFEPFFTTKPSGAGTGLGLSLSYDIITQGHQGTMEVAASASGGAEFKITLPL